MIRLEERELAGLMGVKVRVTPSKGGDALTEVERSAANYKLFRSLVLVFVLDAILSFIPRESKVWCQSMVPGE